MSDAVPLSNWQKFVRIAVSSVLPGGHYQEVGKVSFCARGHLQILFPNCVY